MKYLIGTKKGMTQRFLDDGSAVAVTVVNAGPCNVTAVKLKEKDGYEATQIGFDTRRKLSKAETGHLKKNPKYGLIHEFPYNKDLKEGDTLTVEQFVEGDQLKVTGTSKGKGFQGVVKRHGFAGSPASHGHKDQLRMPGSIGATGPARVFKNVRMPGRMGGEQVTTDGLSVVEVLPEENIILIKGAIPGPTGAFVFLYSKSTSEGTKREVKEEKSVDTVETSEKVEAKPEEKKTEEKVK